MKKRKLSLLTVLSMLLVSSCNNTTSESLLESDSTSENDSISESISVDPMFDNSIKSFIISNINDTLNENETFKVYQMYADHDDRFVFVSDYYANLSIYNENYELIKENFDELDVTLSKNQIVYLKVENKQEGNNKIAIKAHYMNNPIKLPYPTNFIEQEIDTSYSNEKNILKDAEVNYVKRSGGTYVYSNNPELFKNEDVNTCLMKNENLSGEVYMAFEHANYSSKPTVYLGYKLVNETDHDVYVTVENVGFQAGGSWFGQLAWYDFYNTKFTLPSDYLVNGQISSKYAGYDYGYQDYTPRVYTPTTYKLPANESFFVIGGTTNASYNKINVDNSANKPLGIMKCSNGQVKFNVSNGSVTGMMLIYDSASKISDDMQEVGYVTLRNGADFGRQYQGIAHHSGVIDNNMKWEFNDQTPSQSLPVKYTNKRAFMTSGFAPYEEYDNSEQVRYATSWMTHLNPQNDHKAVGMDIVDFICKTTDGKEVVIDSYHADGSGETANTANWMIEYQDNFTFVNKGNKTRKVILKIKDHGTLATLIRDKDGNVLQTYYSVGLAEPNYVEYSFEVAPTSSLQIVLDYLLVACSYGNVTHEVTLI